MTKRIETLVETIRLALSEIKDENVWFVLNDLVFEIEELQENLRDANSLLNEQVLVSQKLHRQVVELCDAVLRKN